MTDRNAGQANGERGVRRAPAGERRVITALFCDVVNSTTLAEQLDPEDWADIMNDAFGHLTEPVHRYGGTVNKLMGDAILAFFGAPVAHEDDPQRAILAGLDIIQGIRGYADEVRTRYGLEFNVRVGINTGPVVVADVGSPLATDHTALGDAVNVAARMEQTAEAGTVQISADTYRLVAPLFDVQPLGEIELKGKREKVAAYRIVGVRQQPGSLRGIEGVSAPLIGREREFDLLNGAVERVRQGRGGIVSLIGEAGLGKSRLVSEVQAHWQTLVPGWQWATMTGVPYDMNRPFGLFQNFARGMFGVDLDDTPARIHEKVRGALVASGASDYQVSLCSVAFERVIAARELHEGPQFAPSVVRQDVFDQMYPATRRYAEERPAVYLVDDLQWGDQASVDLLLHLMPLVEEVPILFVLCFRPERQSPAWQAKLKAETDFPHRYSEILLKPLDTDGTSELLSELLKIDDLPSELRALILRKSDGNPYFVEEIVRMLIDEGAIEKTADGLRWNAAARLDDFAIPDSLQALLMARIDRLDQDAKSTLQLAAVIGRSFYYRILQAISDSAITLDRHLGSLERVELLSEATRRPELEYVFKHELARDAAYGTILNRRRREFHRRVGEAIETLFADRLDEQAHRLATHFRLAGDNEKALRYFEMAGDAAAGLHAEAESAEQYGRAEEAARALGADEAVIARLAAKRAALTSGAAGLH